MYLCVIPDPLHWLDINIIFILGVKMIFVPKKKMVRIESLSKVVVAAVSA